MKCIQCGSANILENVRAVDRGHSNVRRDLALETYKDPGALLFKGARSASLEAKVCEACGFVMLFAAPGDVARLKQSNTAPKPTSGSPEAGN